MCSNLRHIGFRNRSEDDLAELVDQLVDDTTDRVAAEGGDYRIWRSATGAEVWLYVEGSRRADGGLDAARIVGLQSFFDPGNRCDVHVDRLFRRPGEPRFVGSVVGRLVGDRDGAAAATPVVFDAVGFDAPRGCEVGGTGPVQLVAFGRMLTAYADEAAFRKAGSETAGLSPSSLVATGLLASPITPSSHALVIGTVVRHARHQNEVSGLPFDHITVACPNAPIDIVIDSTLVPAAVRPGAIVSAMCWMVGRFRGDH
jgi:hypothetical protein